MIKSLVLLLAFQLVGFAVPPVTTTSMSVPTLNVNNVVDTNGVYVSLRTDGLAGAGTFYDPFDGSTAPKYDALMRGFPAGRVINLMDGVFLTTGSFSYNEVQGWYVQEGWKVRGRGMNQTTVRNIYSPAANQGHVVFEMAQTYQGRAEISNLTVDENWQNLGASPSNVMCAVALYGNHNTIRRVRAINGYGFRTNLHESFELTIRSRHNGTEWEDNVNALIEGCEVFSYRGDYGIAISLVGGFTPEGVTEGTITGIVRGNRVTDFWGTAPFGMNGIIEGNYTSNCWQAVYTDTGVVENAIIRSNYFLDTAGSAIYAYPILGVAPAVNNLMIDGNVIESNGLLEPPQGVGFAPLEMGGITSAAIRSNTFLKKATGPYAASVGAIFGGWVEGLLIDGNLVAEGMGSDVFIEAYPNVDLVIENNRTPSGGIPPGLEDYP